MLSKGELFMKNWKKLLTVLTATALTSLVALAPATAFADDALPAGVQAIKDAGVLKVGVKEDVPGFGFFSPDTNEHEGFEIDLARRIAEEITGSADNVEFTGVTAKTRGPLLDNGEVDMIIATFTITEERKETYNFTEPYYTDEVGFLVKKAAGLTDLASLMGKNIGVSQTSTTQAKIEEEGAKDDLSFNFSEYATYPELKAALTASRIDAFAVDKSILSGYVDDQTEILEVGFAPQEYGVTTKLDNKELNDYLNALLAEWEEDGSLAEMKAAHGLD